MDYIYGIVYSVPSVGVCDVVVAYDIAILIIDGNEFADGNDDSDPDLVSNGMGNISDVDRTCINGAGLIMQPKHFLIVALLIISILPAMAAPVADFTISYVNTTNSSTIDPLTTLNVTKSMVLIFNDTSTGGAVTYNWSMGDGYRYGTKDVRHKYAFGTGGTSLGFIPEPAGKFLIIRHYAIDGVGDADYKEKNLTLHSSMPSLIISRENVTLMDETASNQFIQVVGGNGTIPSGWIGVDFLGGLRAAEGVYVSVLGLTIFLLVVFSLPFIMNWIVTKDFVVSGIIGGFMGIWIITRLPDAMKPLAVIFIGMSIVAIIYSLIKERT